MAGKPGGLGEGKVMRIGGDNQYGFIEPDVKRVEKAIERYRVGDSVLTDLKAVYNGEGLRASPSTNRSLDYGTPSKNKNP